jgi:hypothetical protein
VFGHSAFVWSNIKLGLEVLSAVAVRQGWIEVSYGLKLLQFLGVVCKTKNTKIRYESEYVFRMRKGVTTNYKIEKKS